MKKTTKVIFINIFLIALSIFVSKFTHDQSYLNRLLRKSVSSDHLLACDNLPTITEVDKIWKEHLNEFYNTIGVIPRDTVDGDTIPGRVKGEWGKMIWDLPCNGMGDIVFLVDTSDQKERVQKKYKSSFYNIPYRIYVQ